MSKNKNNIVNLRGGDEARVSLRGFDTHLDKVLMSLMTLEAALKKCDPLFCNDTHLNDALDMVDHLRSIYDDIKEYCEIIKGKK